MRIATVYHHATDAVLTLAGMSDKMAHLNAGLVIYVATQALLRTRRASGKALLAVLACELANEAMDVVFWGELRFADTIGDIVATLAWPTMLFGLSKYRRRRFATGMRHARQLEKTGSRTAAIRVPEKSPPVRIARAA